MPVHANAVNPVKAHWRTLAGKFTESYTLVLTDTSVPDPFARGRPKFSSRAKTKVRVLGCFDYVSAMPTTKFQPCIPTRGTEVPAGRDWLHEIKHDGYRLIVQREGKHVRLLTGRL